MRSIIGRRKVAGAAILVLIAGFSAWWFHESKVTATLTVASRSSSPATGANRSPDSSSNAPQADEDAQESARPSPDLSAGRARSLRDAQLGSMPPLAEPLAARVSDLETRANSGDTNAGLELWYGLEQCRSVMSDSELHFLRNADPKQAAAFAEGDARILDNCKDIGSAQIDARYSWLKQAAALGNSQAQFFYALAGTSAFGGVDAALRNPSDWVDYKDTAAKYLTDLSEQCDPYSIANLHYAYARGTQMYAPDQSKSYFYALIGQLINPPGVPAALELDRQGLTPQQVDQLTRAAGEFYQAHCR